ncbi:hypothetical protein C3L33_14787, partial [Rhododendron williamsianum]
MASELPNCSSSVTGVDELDELEATEIDESLTRDLLEELLEKDEEVKNDQTSCTCAIQPTEATAIETVHPGVLSCDEFLEHTTGSHVHDTLWLDIMEMDPPSPMMNELVMMVWYGESCVEEEMGGGMVDFVGNGSDESQLYHHGALSTHDDKTTYGFLWRHDNL